MFSSQLESWMTYVEKPGMTSYMWSSTTGLIVSATYIHNCDPSGPTAMSSWRVTKLSWIATGSTCQQVSMLRPWWRYTNPTKESRIHVYMPARVFWIGTNVKHWGCCAQVPKMQRAQPREPVMPPTRACQIMGTDLFVINHETSSSVWSLFKVSFHLYMRDPKASDTYRSHW